MKILIIKICVFFTTFFISLFGISNMMNKGSDNLTKDMPSATFPTIILEKEGILYNELYGYAKPMDLAYQRESITELGGNRELIFIVNTFQTKVDDIRLEVRNREGDRLIENTQVTEYLEDSSGKIRVETSLKDLLEKDTEYLLTFILTIENEREVRYYTRVIWSDSTYTYEKLSFVIDFNQKTFDKEEASEITRYLESNSSGNNTSFHKVNINSSFQQITWGTLNPKMILEPMITMKEVATQTATFLLNYIVTVGEESNTNYYFVEESYRIRYTSDRMYLLSFDREMTQMPVVEKNICANDKIILGIVDSQVPMMESSDGNIVVFYIAGRLCSYNITTNRMALLFSFYDEKNSDRRNIYPKHEVKILDVDEGGNVQFAVYGYMNRGRHEGEVGIEINTYNSTLNTIEEVIYISSEKSSDMLIAEVSKLISINREGILYFYLNNCIYEVDTMTRQSSIIAKVDNDEEIEISLNHKIIVWHESDSLYSMNFSTGEKIQIKAGENEAIRPLGFMGEDIVYGVARKEDIVLDEMGRTFFPMYKICIQSTEGVLLKEYVQENIYITSCQIIDNQITLERVSKSADHQYREIENEQIISNIQVTESRNKIVEVVIDNFQKIVQIQVKNNIDTKSISLLTPMEVVFEGGRELVLELEEMPDRYYVYNGNGINGIFYSPALALSLAEETAGVVINETGNIIWLRGNRLTRNQIMAIGENAVTTEKNSLAICLDTILQYEGITRNSELLLEDGQNAQDILENNILNISVLDLSGCSMDAMLYYVNQDIPVLVSLKNGESQLIVGFNEYNVVIMDPVTGTLSKKGMNDTALLYEENGNQFITYVRNN